MPFDCQCSCAFHLPVNTLRGLGFRQPESVCRMFGDSCGILAPAHHPTSSPDSPPSLPLFSPKAGSKASRVWAGMSISQPRPQEPTCQPSAPASGRASVVKLSPQPNWEHRHTRRLFCGSNSAMYIGRSSLGHLIHHVMSRVIPSPSTALKYLLTTS